MRIDVVTEISRMNSSSLHNKVAIVIDVLRASSVIVTALLNGAKAVVPVLTEQEARNLAAPDVLLCGEREALPLPGFDLGNSPLEYKADIVRGKTIVLTTSNGTVAINCSKSADQLLIGSVLNATAVANAAIKTGKDVLLVCSGTNGSYTLDDAICAGMIASKIANIEKVDMSDEAQGLEFLYRKYEGELKKLLQNTHHYKVLVKKGFEKDLVYCLQEDFSDLVPILKDGVIIKQQKPEITQ